jgi:nucleotide-binding universal stress UspA family protein
VEYIVRSGKAGEIIAKQAKNFGVDLVVLGMPVDEPAGEDSYTSTVTKVISEVKCPVLCVPFTQDSASAELVQEVSLI